MQLNFGVIGLIVDIKFHFCTAVTFNWLLHSFSSYIYMTHYHHLAKYHCVYPAEVSITSSSEEVVMKHIMSFRGSTLIKV